MELLYSKVALFCITRVYFLLLGDRLRNLSIQIGKQQDTLHAVAFFEGPGTDGSYHVLPIPNLIGRYVKLEIANTMGAILTLCEVEVMGTEVRRGK